MKILFSVESYPRPDSPFAAFVGELCREMTRQGHEITVVAPQSLTMILKKLEKKAPRYFVDRVEVGDVVKDIKVYRPYYLTLGFGFFKKISILSKKKAFERIANKLPVPDVCYAHFWSSGYSALDYSMRKDLPLFVASGEDRIFFHQLISRKDLKHLSDYVKGVICVSTKNQDESIAAGLTVKEKCIVCPNAIDNKCFYPQDKEEIRKILGYSQNDFIVAFVGRFYYRKGVKRVSEAIKLLGGKNVKSIFIGRATSTHSEEPDCEGILFKGSLPHEDIPKYLNAADVFVLPSLAEGCSNSIVEAMACGLPVISSDLPFNYDILNASNSFLVNPEDINQIAVSIKKLKDDIVLRRSMSIGAINTASELTLPKRAEKIIDFICNIINKR